MTAARVRTPYVRHAGCSITFVFKLRYERRSHHALPSRLAAWRSVDRAGYPVPHLPLTVDDLTRYAVELSFVRLRYERRPPCSGVAFRASARRPACRRAGADIFPLALQGMAPSARHADPRTTISRFTARCRLGRCKNGSKAGEIAAGRHVQRKHACKDIRSGTCVHARRARLPALVTPEFARVPPSCEGSETPVGSLWPHKAADVRPAARTVVPGMNAP